MDLELVGVSYRYPSRASDALCQVDLEVDQGELVGVVGLNGAGKTTLCNLCVGIIPHFYKGEFTGDVRVRGVDTRASSIAELAGFVGYVFQQPTQQFSGTAATVYEEVAFGPENLGLDRAETRRRVQEALDLLHIDTLADRSPWEISGGQQQRLALASVLAMRPSILVLDEPTSQLDPVGTHEVFAAIGELWRHGMTVVLVEHKLDLLAEVATRVVQLDGGRVVADGPASEVLRSPALETHGLQRPTLAQLGAALNQPDLPLELERAVAVLKS